MKWKLNIDEHFSKVRELIEEEIETPRQCMLIMYELEHCCDVLTPNDKEDWAFYEDFRDFKTEIHEEVEYMDEDDYESCADTVDNYLSDFYDLCDYAGVWLGI